MTGIMQFGKDQPVARAIEREVEFALLNSVLFAPSQLRNLTKTRDVYATEIFAEIVDRPRVVD